MNSVLKARLKRIVRLNDKVFFLTLLSQVLLATVISAAIIFISVRSSRNDATAKVQSIFKNYEKRVTEAAYVESILNGSLPEKLPINDEIKGSLTTAGLPNSEVRFASCAANLSGSKFSLNIGQSYLSKCLFISPSKDNGEVQISWMCLAGLLSLLVITAAWYFIRRIINGKVVSPLLQTIEDESHRAILGELAAQVAHDIRSPLTALNFVAKLSDDLAPEKRKLISEAVGRIDAIAENLLERNRALQTKSESSQIFPSGKTESVSVQDVISSLIREKTHGQNSRSIELVRLTPENLSVRVVKSAFTCALSNVMNNAIEASPIGSKVVCRIVTEAEFVKISIEDRGSGFPKKVLMNLGAGFSVGKVSGNGLGLRQALSFSEVSGGDFSVVANPHGGSVVTFRLPLEQKYSSVVKTRMSAGHVEFA